MCVCKECIESGDERNKPRKPYVHLLVFATTMWIVGSCFCAFKQNHVDVGYIKELAHLLGMAKPVRDTKEGKTST